ncbi:MAG: aminopeptidase P family protein, partial [Deltaproteobacteria bacterium]|nr:aminopeptidase P family protein [Deltaproteobacteria bacterium]
MRLTPTLELESRIGRLQEEIALAKMDAVLILQNADMFYFTGSIQQGALFIPVSGKALYMVRKDFSRARMESGLQDVLPIKSPKDIPVLVADHGYQMPQSLGMELDVLPVKTYQRFKKAMGDCQVCDASHLIRKIRAVKSDYEIGILKDAALILGKIHQRAKEVIREGMTDLDLAAELEYVARKAGHQGLIRMRGFNNELFYGHIFSGPDSAVPTYSDTPLGGVG